MNYLIDLLEYDVPAEILSGAEILTEYSVEARYPGEFAIIYAQEAQDILLYAEKIKAFILDKAKNL